jgi:phospholipid-binding lipoprotein MlaA
MLDKNLFQTLKVLGILISACHLAGCAKAKKPDPLEGVNRAIYAMNKTVDKLAIKPIVRVYKALIPKPAQSLVTNFFQNLMEIPNVGNDILQGKFPDARRDAARFMINSTWGFGGLLDVASAGGIAKNQQDFGKTLAYWGWKDSSYFVIPLLGPSTIRDTVGLVPYYYMWPPGYVKSVKARNRLLGLDYIDHRVGLLKAEPLIDESVDEYIFIRDAYLQRRQFQMSSESANENFANNPDVVLEGPPE